MLRKVIATGVAGLGISAIAMVPSAMPEENSLLLLQQQISRLTEAIQRKMAADEERFRRIEEDIRQLKRRPDNTTTAQPTTAQPTTAQPTTTQPTTAQPTTTQPTTAQPTTAQPTTAQPTTAQPTTAQPTTAQPTTAQPTTAQPATAQPTTAQPITARPITAQPSSVQPPRHRHYYPRHVPRWESWW
jgi:hypothetical protein